MFRFPLSKFGQRPDVGVWHVVDYFATSHDDIVGPGTGIARIISTMIIPFPTTPGLLETYRS
jgi:hypothetical protein